METRSDDEGGTGPGTDLIEAGYALSGGDGCIAQARRDAADFLKRAREERGVDVSSRAMDLTQLVVSELVTNVRKYAPGPALMRLRVTGAMVEVAVRDSDRTVPTVEAADPGRIGRHGLEIVQAVAHELVVERQPDGKRVIARIVLADPPGDDAAGRRPS
ncbi:anti-sigma regulatory factor (Ser/Thr protein kinase) [Streptomyces achromogenes]|uniref:Anti-sigma regulatory factor (Ser/Thr protein kinase) n=1 Tax=Streptomyces achromogenes TaxID=67255 RepID=A0ABU0PUX2_STRAH|nr:ATP-binding protein [Streptomyces achromogenes]MDQ0681448.1 anti-sigma regulatory factor (Ser/Thr protein kinase) [Streptomyces achromogenes]